jgi:hypothetical protein
MLGVLMLGFGWAGMTGACTQSEPAPVNSCDTPPDTPTDTPTTCPAPVEEPCMRYRIPLVNNPSFDVELRNKYIAAFGDACYISVVHTFDCFYKDIKDACKDAKKIGEVAGIVPYDDSYECEPDGVGNYTLQIGSDVANKIQINYQAAPRQTPLVEIDGVPTEVNGPYRNLPEPPTLGPGQPFNKCDSGMVNDKGEALSQRNYILQVNRNANGGKIRSDLAGFTWPCEDEECKPKICKELEFIADPDSKVPPFHPDSVAEVHHVVPMKDKRSCDWGTNSNKNAAVISRALNQYFTNNNPPGDEVKILNAAKALTP